MNEGRPMTGDSADRAKMAAERLMAENLMDLPVTALSGSGLVVQSCAARVLKTSKSRPVLRYALTCLGQEDNVVVRKEIIGKGYYRYDGAETYGYMSRLWAEGFGKDRYLTIPEPIAYLPEMKLLLQGQAPGEALYEYIDRPADATEPVRLAARWLAKLHGTRLPGVPALPTGYEETKLTLYRDVLARIRPRFGARIESITERVLVSLRGLDPRRAVPTHGDFQPKNVYVAGDRATVIDFDRFASANPARDLGHFVGQSMTMSYVRTGSFEEIRPWNAAFLDEYARLAPPGALSALPVFVARTFMEVLKHKVFLDPSRNARLLPAWLDECEGWLTGTRDPTKTRSGVPAVGVREREG